MVAKRDVVRLLILSGAAAAALVDLTWIFGWARNASLPLQTNLHFVLTAKLWQLDAEVGVGSITQPFYWVTSLACLLACGLAAALTFRRKENSYASDLSATLAAGSAVVAWFYFVRVFDEFGVSHQLNRAWVIAVDLLASTMACLALPWFVAFVARFPTEVAIELFQKMAMWTWEPDPANLSWPARCYRSANQWLMRFSVRCSLAVAALSRRCNLPKVATYYDYLARKTRVRIAGGELATEDQTRHDRWLGFSLVGSGRGWFLTFGVMGLAAGLAWRLALPFWPVQYVLWYLPIILFGTFMLHATLSMTYKYRYGPFEQRRQIEWIVWGILVGFLVFFVPVVTLKPGLIDFVFGWLVAVDAKAIRHWLIFSKVVGSAAAVAVIGLSIVLSVFYRGAIDPGLALRRTTTYAVLAVALTTTFVALEGIASASIVTGLGLSNQSGALIAGSAVALLFNPIRHRVEIGVERLINHLRPAELLAEGKRYVAAVMFSDLSGYTALSARDEKAALTMAALFHKEARRAAEGAGGRLVKTIGDAALTVYPDSAAALTALARLHERYRIGAELLELPVLPIHSGIHSGEVVEAPDGDVFGATVNLAARLEGQAQGGQAVLSEAAAVAARTAQIELQSLGERRLKNVDEPVPCSVWTPGTKPLAPVANDAR